MSKFKEYSLSKSLDSNIEMIKKIFNNNDDTLIIRSFQNQHNNSLKCCIFFIEGMVNNEIINENIILPIVETSIPSIKSNFIEYLQYQVIVSNNLQKTDSIDQLIEAVISGNTILFAENSLEAIIIDTKGWQSRAIEEPIVERVLRGPREGFTECIMVNLALIRRKLRTSDLKFEFTTLGERTNTKACICYIEGLANEKILKELHKRLESISIDGVLDVNYINELVSDSPLSPFETTGSTERPDIIAAKLLEGRIALVLDGTPVVMTVPYLFIEYFQSNEDYYLNYYFASIGRVLRIFGFIASISIPAVYLSLVAFHQEMIPTPLIMSIYAARQGVPFPTAIELIVLLITFEILREAGTRMPSYIGQALSIVGALVLGSSAVEARLVSAPIVIVVGLSGITGLMIPKIKSVSVTMRFIFLFLSSLLGLYGYIFGMSALLIHLFSIRSFGVPYMSNLTSLHLQELKDTTIRSPWWYMKDRPGSLSKNLRRTSRGQRQ
ncbi:spore germination protein [Tissierella sp. MSJ-40]|uniref:Spore germination protein n=1 Tax=Tissierella simiarum TaxID=2841534 RepID=A0ABS6ECE8_9FIRM|nr:spore germination protein [Tissierella simiarum]MBU5440140.1 spore germination protein [Tissierella simiarum]